MVIPIVLGAIAIAGLAKGGASGVKMKKTKTIIDEHKARYDENYEQLKKLEKITMNNMDNLGKNKLYVYESFTKFSELFETIKNKPEIEDYNREDGLNITTEELKEFKEVSLKATDVLATLGGSTTAGALAGFAAYNGVMAFGAASTGTAISSLSGAAATNATLAWLGGGSLAAGGGGIAAGTMVLSGLVAAPALLVGSYFISKKANEMETNAEEIKQEVDAAIKSMKTAESEFEKIDELVSKFSATLEKIKQPYFKELNRLDVIVSLNNDYSSYTEKEKAVLFNTVALVKLLKSLLDISLFDENNKISKDASLKMLEVEYNFVKKKID